jgi:iron complex outermembrane recepter protein
MMLAHALVRSNQIGRKHTAQRERAGIRRNLAVIAVALAPISAAWAQAGPAAQGEPAAPSSPESSAAEEPGLQEIVITATRRSELLSKVPVSVSAYSQETLDAKGVKDITDVVRFTPGLKIDEDGSNVISIRGIASAAGNATTGIYIDETPIQMRILGFNPDNALPKTFDLDRIEVLRGPQGTLFGAGAEGGAVRYLMNQPRLNKTDLSARTEFSFTQGGAPSYEAGIAGGMPLVENVLGVRGSFWYRHDGGWIDRVDPFTGATTDHSTNYAGTIAARLAAKAAITEDLSLTPSVVYQQRRLHDQTLYYPILSDPGSDSYKNAQPLQQAVNDTYVLPALKADADLGFASLISNTSYFVRGERGGYSGTTYNLSYYQTFFSPGGTPPIPPNPLVQTPVNLNDYPLVDANGIHLPLGLRNYRASAPVTNQQQSWTQEVRLTSNDTNAKLLWTAGLFYTRNKQTSIEAINDPMLPQLFQGLFAVDYTTVFGVPLLPNGDSYRNNTFSRDSEFAGFGEVSYSITSKLKATAGLRYSRTSTSFNNNTDGPQNFGPASSSGAQNEKPFNPKLSLSYQANRDNMFYATYSRGYRIGGVNAPVPAAACQFDLANLNLTAAPGSYKSDRVSSYEIGAKNKIGDKLQVASSLYFIRWHGIQQNVYLPTCAFQFIANLGEAISKGGDVQLEYLPTSNLHVDLAAGYTNARYTQTVGTAPFSLVTSGNAVEGQAYGPPPPWTVSIGAQWDFSAFNRKSFVRVDYEYLSRSDVPTPIEDPRNGSYDPYIFTANGYSLVSLRAGMTVAKWNISAFVDNLFDVHPQELDSSEPHSGVDPYNPNPPSVLVTAFTIRPRTMGVSASYRF